MQVKNNLQDKIEERMLEIEYMMDQNFHLTENLHLTNLLDSVRKFWSVLSEQDREYLEGVQYAMEHKLMWEA